MPEKKYTYVRKTFTFEGKRYEVSGKTEAEAIEKAVLKKQQLETAAAAESGSATVSQWYSRWLALYKAEQGLTQKSLSTYDEKFNNYIKPAIGGKKMRAVTEYDLQRIMNRTAEKSQSTASKVRMVIRQMFRRAYRTHMISFDPSEDLEIPRSTTKGTRRSLTEAERALFLRCAPSVEGAEIFQAMYYTGMRPGELMALTWGDIDFNRNEITVNKAIESGTKSTVKATKTSAGERIIPLRAPLRELLLPFKGDPTRHVFLNRAGNPQYGQTFKRLWKHLLREMDIANGAKLYRNQIVQSTLAPDLVPYCLRHTFCTDLQAAGVPINIAKELMGHADISVTANIYTHKNTQTLHANIRLLDP